MKQSFAVVAVLVVLVLGLAWAGEEPTGEEGRPDSEMGVSQGSVFDTITPALVLENETSPGEIPPPPRPNEEAPPVIPHGIIDFVPITVDSNMCMDCHAVEDKQEGEPTPIPASHYVDSRNKPGERGEQVAGARYLCISCHVSQTAAEPLVDNSAAAPDHV